MCASLAANRQWHLADDVTADPSETSFHKAILLSRGTIAIVDKLGMYFDRIWCCYEIFVALTVKEEMRDEQVRGEPFTYDLYTATHYKHESTPDWTGAVAHATYYYGVVDAVGITDGVVAADRGYSPDYDLTSLNDVGVYSEAGEVKANREAGFPKLLVDKAIRAQTQAGKASVDADRRHILNTIIGEKDLDAEAPTDHANYEAINALLNARACCDASSSAAPMWQREGADDASSCRLSACAAA